MRPDISLLAQKTADGFALDRARLARLIEQLKDGVYELSIERYLGTRSKKANAYYWAVVVKSLADDWGLDPADAHELIKQHCNSKTVEVLNKQTGEMEETVIAASTAGLNKQEWAEFIERCQRWAAEDFHVVIPDPDPEYALHQYESASRRD